MKYLLALLCLLLLLLIPAPASAAPKRQTSNKCEQAVQAAVSKRGAGYVWGEKGPDSFDCSGLTYWAYLQAGINIGVSTYDQALAGQRTGCTLADLNGSSTSCWKLGDLIFLRYSGGQHVALYAGSGKFMDCYNPDTGCIVHDVKSDGFYQANFWQARRIIADCDDPAFDPGSTTTPIFSPDIEAIADMWEHVFFTVPQCGDCNPSSLPIEKVPEPQIGLDPTSPFRWLAWKIGDLIRSLLCFLLSFLQLLANILAAGVNVFIDAANAFWRLFVLTFLTAKEWLLTIWIVIEEFRAGFIGLAGLSQLAEVWLAMIGQLIAELAQIVGELAAMLLDLAFVLFGLIAWIGAIAAGTFSAFFNGIGSTTIPVELSNTARPQFYQIIRGFGEGLVDSKIGWIFNLIWGLCYLAAILWIVQRISSTEGAE